MTPTMDAPVSGGDNFSELSNMFAELPGGSKDTGTADATTQAATETPAAEVQATTEATPDAAGTTPAEGTPATDPASPYQLTEDGNSYIIPKLEFATFQGVKDYAQAVQQRFPTAQDAEVAHFQASDLRGIRADFLSGDESRVDAVLNYFAGNLKGVTADEKAQFQNAFGVLAQRMPDTLRKVNPQAYDQLSDRVIRSQIDAAYDRASQSGDPLDLEFAQHLDWGHTGAYKTELPKQDPAQVAQQQFDSRQRDIEQREQTALKRDFEYFDKSSMDGPKWTAFNGEIAKILAPVKDKYDPAMFDAVQAQVSKKVTDGIKSDYEWARDHENDRAALVRDYQALWKNQQSSQSLKPRLQAYQNDFMTRVRRILPSIAASYLGKATAAAVTKPTPAKPASQPPTQAATPRSPNGQFQKPAPAEPYDIIADVRNAMRLS